MSDKALRMLKHMRKQILRQPAPYVVVRGAAISIGVDPGGSECDGLVKELLRDGHLQRYPPAPALPRTVCTDLPTWAYPQPTRDKPRFAAADTQEGVQRPWWRKLIRR